MMSAMHKYAEMPMASSEVMRMTEVNMHKPSMQLTNAIIISSDWKSFYIVMSRLNIFNTYYSW